MKRLILATSLVFVANVPVAVAKPPTRDHVKVYLTKYNEVQVKFGKRTPGCKLVGSRPTCHQAVTDAAVVKSTLVLERILAPPPPPPAPAPVYTSTPAAVASTAVTTSTPTTSSVYYPTSTPSGGYSNVPGVPSSFASCVALRESTNGVRSSNIYGIQGPGGQGSITEQKAAFSQMYAARGTEPWAPYDGC